MKQGIVGEKRIGTLSADCLTILWQERDGIVILGLRGNLQSGASHACFDEVIDTFASGRKKVVLNLGSVNRMDSRGIGSIVNAAVKLEHRIAAVAVSRHINSLLAICKLTTVLPSFETEADAIEALASE